MRFLILLLICAKIASAAGSPKTDCPAFDSLCRALLAATPDSSHGKSMVILPFVYLSGAVLCNNRASDFVRVMLDASQKYRLLNADDAVTRQPLIYPLRDTELCTVGKRLSADYVLAGMISVVFRGHWVFVKMMHTGTGETVASASAMIADKQSGTIMEAMVIQ